jgi:hypothetical protein
LQNKLEFALEECHFIWTPTYSLKSEQSAKVKHAGENDFSRIPPKVVLKLIFRTHQPSFKYLG